MKQNELSVRLWSALTNTATRDFMVMPDGAISYAVLRDGINRWLGAFDSAGLRPGDRIVVRTDRDDVAATAFLAGLLDGIVPVLLEGTCPDTRLSSIVSAVAPGLVLSDRPLPELPEGTAPVLLDPPATSRGFFRRRPTRNFGIVTAAAARAPGLPSDGEYGGLAYLLFTSGTTAAPSGVQISRSNLSANLDTLTRLFGYDSDSRIFNDMVLAHTDGLNQGPVLAAWTGSTVIRAGGFQVQRIEDWLGTVRQHRVTHVLTAPTVWAMIDAYAAHDDYFDAPECCVLMSVAAKLPADLWDRIEARFKRPLVSHYGLTETVVSALYAGDWPGLGARHTAGLPVDCEARIAGTAPQGELELRGTNVFAGYWQNPERTRASFTQDGWFRTGDLAAARDDGSYEIIGRLKLVIKCGGVLIHPDEIDEAMLRHTAVRESATIAMPDRIFGEVGVTVVVLRAAGNVSETDLTEHLRTQVEPRKVSRRIVIVPAIQRGPSGKAQGDALRELVLSLPMDSEDGGAIDQHPKRDDTLTEVLAIAARVFRVPEGSLSASSTAEDVAGWDSFTHLNLILSVERHFDGMISARQVSTLRDLGDLARAVDIRTCRV